MPISDLPPRPHRRAVPLRFNGPKLVLCIALGVWLGMTAAFFTSWYAYKALSDKAPAVPDTVGHIIRPEPPVSSAPMPTPAIRPAPVPDPPVPVAPAPTTNDSSAMFDQYQQNLRSQQLQQAEQAARANPRNLSNAKCQFWLQQAQTAPSQKSLENVAQLCE